MCKYCRWNGAWCLGQQHCKTTSTSVTHHPERSQPTVSLYRCTKLYRCSLRGELPHCADSTKGLLEDTTAVDKVDAEGFDAVFLPGGHGVVVDLPTCEPMQKFVAAMYDQGKVVASVCHGPAAFANITLANGEPLVKGKKACPLLRLPHEYSDPASSA
ncbi:MAG: hypothetical protein HC767_13720 [Akkermansiaceae bacterium]|nr:hypothetical protein [Akkermansiaceae bacterium]